MRDVLARSASELERAGCESPRLDAELLLAESLGTDRAGLVLAGHHPLHPSAAARFSALLARRIAREPIAYILGRREFRYLTLAVDRRALIPRPETELLIEVGLTLPRGARVADVGTGSGAIALALKHERPDLLVTGLDRDASAIELARMNGRQQALDVEWVVADLLGDGERVFDAVLANLPYVPDGTALAPEIVRYEPLGALFSGADGLGAIRLLCARLDGVSLVALEHGAEQGPAVRGLVSDAGFSELTSLHDLAGHERVVVGRR